MSVLLHPTAFPNNAHFLAMIKANQVIFEAHDNYVKQTFRNRYEILGPNGKLALTIPVNYTQKNRQRYKDVRIANDDQWQKQHLKSLRTAYNLSPFYEFYEDELLPLFTERFDFIYDFNLKSLEVLCACLQIEIKYTFSKSFNPNVEASIDMRVLVDQKSKVNYQLTPYTQVFSDKHGFVPNLSILDLLFNEGPNTINFLEKKN